MFAIKYTALANHEPIKKTRMAISRKILILTQWLLYSLRTKDPHTIYKQKLFSPKHSVFYFLTPPPPLQDCLSPTIYMQLFRNNWGGRKARDLTKKAYWLQYYRLKNNNKKFTCASSWNCNHKLSKRKPSMWKVATSRSKAQLHSPHMSFLKYSHLEQNKSTNLQTHSMKLSATNL